MRFHSCVLMCVLLAETLPCFGGSSCKVGFDFDHAPERVRDFSGLLKKAETGDPDAQFRIALAYESGVEIERDLNEAAGWYRKAADHGNPAAQNNLGSMYLRGLGVTQSDSDAVKWFTRAAVEGFPAVQNNLGLMYARGKGVLQNDAVAVTWYRKAAARHYAPAESNLGFMYLQGRGVPADTKRLRNCSAKPPKQGMLRPNTISDFCITSEVVSSGTQPSRQNCFERQPQVVLRKRRAELDRPSDLCPMSPSLPPPNSGRAMRTAKNDARMTAYSKKGRLGAGPMSFVGLDSEDELHQQSSLEARVECRRMTIARIESTVLRHHRLPVKTLREIDVTQRKSH